MKIPDQHMHTINSPDASNQATFENYLGEATKQGVKSLTFTDHVDLDTPVELFQMMPDYYAYATTLKRLQKTTDIQLRMGVEIGYQPHLHHAYDAFLSRHAFDFVIMSLHVGDGLDFYNGDFFEGKTQNEAYKRYFELVVKTVEAYDNYDVFGHLDYIIRYGNFAEKDYDFATYQPLIDRALTAIIAKGKGIELNTSGLRYGLEHTHPKFDLIKRYKALGGEIITLGSDAHDPSDYRADFKAAIDLLKDAGFNEVAVFENRKPFFIPFD